MKKLACFLTFSLLSCCLHAQLLVSNAEKISDGAVFALKGVTSTGVGYFAGTAQKSHSPVWWQLERSHTKDANKAQYRLKRKTDGLYLAKPANPTSAIALTNDATQAAELTIEMGSASFSHGAISNFDAMLSTFSSKDLVRINASVNNERSVWTFLNTQATQATPKWATGTGAWSVWAFYEADNRPIVKPPLAAKLKLHRIPCGVRSSYLSLFTLSDFTYQSAQAPDTHYFNFDHTTQISLKKGATYKLRYQIGAANDETSISLFFDWNDDGVFETEIKPSTPNEADIEVPAQAQLTDGIVRVRINNNGIEGADADVEGTVYDFRLHLQAGDPISGIQAMQAKASSNESYDILGRRLASPTHTKGIVIKNREKIIH